MKVRFAFRDEIDSWDEHILANPNGGDVFSSFEFAMQKKMGGYKPQFIFADNIAITVLEKRPFPGVKLWYLPKGPNVTETKNLLAVLDSLKSFARQHCVFAVRIEPELDISKRPILSRHSLVKSEPIIPNPSTIILNLKPTLDEIMEKLPQKGRHAIKRAEREGVTVQEVETTDKNCKIMYDLLLTTAEGRFGIRNFHYFHSFWQRFEAAKMGQMFFAYFDGKVVAGAYATVMGTKSTYKDGASSREHPVYGASHLLQWHVMRWAKSHGSLRHDLCGSPPSEEINNPKHPHHGIGLFKTAFNKEVTDYVGCYDLVVNPFIYRLWSSIGERAVRRLYWKRHHEQYF